MSIPKSYDLNFSPMTKSVQSFKKNIPTHKITTDLDNSSGLVCHIKFTALDSNKEVKDVKKKPMAKPINLDISLLKL